MMTIRKKAASVAIVHILSVALMIMGPARAEITTATDSHFAFTVEAHSPLAPNALWGRLIDVSSWRGDSHTYSGSAKNMQLDLAPGGLWREVWDGGAVAHGTVLHFIEGKTLRLSAPFGPLQGMAVQTVWTITLTPADDGTKVTFDYVADGGPDSGLGAMAGPVHQVKEEALRALVSAGQE